MYPILSIVNNKTDMETYATPIGDDPFEAFARAVCAELCRLRLLLGRALLVGQILVRFVQRGIACFADDHARLLAVAARFRALCYYSTLLVCFVGGSNSMTGFVN